MISVEDLWDLTPENLDSIYKSLNADLKKAQEESLLNTKTQQDKELEVKIEIVKYIVGVKLAEKEARVKAKENKATKQQLLEVLAAKKAEAIQGKSVEEIEALIKALDE
jgi:Zn-dependent metalloprotease